MSKIEGLEWETVSLRQTERSLIEICRLSVPGSWLNLNNISYLSYV